DGAGGFSAPTDFAAGDFPKSVAMGDLDGDGDLDLAVANFGSDDVSVLLNQTARPATLGGLIEAVEALGLPRVPERSLLAKLERAQRSLARGNTAGACRRLAAFANQVAAQSGKKIPPAEAEALIADALALRESLGCT
ncbi:MAG TPA: FG-GAP-like repeat-containing protein, partial [Thermoleophilaceae bacterium]